MHYFIPAKKDTTIYNLYPDKNTGKDEILEIYKTIISSSNYVSSSVNSRILLQFDLNNIFSMIGSDIIKNPNFYLNLHLCRVEGQEEESVLYIHPMSSSWIEGTGKFYDDVDRNIGATWSASDAETLTYWTNYGGDYLTSSISSSLLNNENIFEETGLYTYELADLRVDISNIVNSWLSSSYQNYGLVIKRSDEEETNNKSYGFLQFYSKDSHTQYSPSLEIAWDDSNFITGSLIESDINDLFIYVRNLKSEYNNRERTKIILGAREMFPSRSYAEPFQRYNTDKYLPETTYYSIIDANSLETIIPFDTNTTKVSCDSNGNYINLWCDGLQAERYYILRVKVVSGSMQNIYEINTPFKVIR